MDIWIDILPKSIWEVTRRRRVMWTQEFITYLVKNFKLSSFHLSTNSKKNNNRLYSIVCGILVHCVKKTRKWNHEVLPSAVRTAQRDQLQGCPSRERQHQWPPNNEICRHETPEISGYTIFFIYFTRNNLEKYNNELTYLQSNFPLFLRYVTVENLSILQWKWYWSSPTFLSI